MKQQQQKQQQATKSFRIVDICDIEESIWSPKYGVKGKLDLTLRASIKMSAYKHLAPITNNVVQSSKEEVEQQHVIPVELKSGKTTFSAEHEGQVMLYSLLNQEKRSSQREENKRSGGGGGGGGGSSDFGLLLYLKDMQMRFVKVNQMSVRGLIQLRNELTHYIASSNERLLLLPEFKNEPRICQKCPLLVPCSLLASGEQAADPANEMYTSAIGYLSAEHRAYFVRWFRMLECEYESERQFEAGELIWWREVSDLERLGWTVANLRLAKFRSSSQESSAQVEVEYSGEGFHLFDFELSESGSHEGGGGSRHRLNLKENDMILLSSQTANLVGIAQGFIRSISGDRRRFALLVDKNLRAPPLTHAHDTFRIDKINFRSAINLNYTNLAKLMASGERARTLRSFLIDHKLPEFDKVLSKQHILQNKVNNNRFFLFCLSI